MLEKTLRAQKVHPLDTLNCGSLKIRSTVPLKQSKNMFYCALSPYIFSGRKKLFPNEPKRIAESTRLGKQPLGTLNNSVETGSLVDFLKEFKIQLIFKKFGLIVEYS